MIDDDMVWVVGAGDMAYDYAKVLNDLNKDFVVIGRSEEKLERFKNEFKCKTVSNGLKNFLDHNPRNSNRVINAVGIESLKSVTSDLLDYGIKNILLEKPGVAYPEEIDVVCEKAKLNCARILLAYNRRFYQSVQKTIELIEEDGGLSSFNFEFTEWAHIIGTLDKDKSELNNWFLGNSTHIIDTAFYVGGDIKSLSTFVSGEKKLNWHPCSSVFAGAGQVINGALFNYQANWNGPGRWSLEFITDKRRIILRPIEKILIQEIGSVELIPYENIDYSIDEKFKPGLYMQTKNFLESEYSQFLDIFGQRTNIEMYKKMSGYN